jgi:hypothetical protein
MPDNQAEIDVLRGRVFQAIDIFLKNSDMKSVSSAIYSQASLPGNIELWISRCNVTILDVSLTALETLLMCFAGNKEESDVDDIDDSNVQQMEWLSSQRNILAFPDAVFMILQKIVYQSPLLMLTSTLSSMGTSGSIASGGFSLKQFTNISRKFGNCCGRLLSIVLSQASTTCNQDTFGTSPAWRIAVQLTEAQFNCFTSELRSVKNSIGRLVSSDSEPLFSSASESCLTADAFNSFVFLARTDPGAVARAALMCSVVAWGSRCVLSHIDGFLFGLATTNPGKMFLAQHFRCDLFQKLVFRTASEELCNCSRLVAFLYVTSSSLFSASQSQSRNVISFLGSLKNLFSDIRSLTFDSVQLVEDLEVLTKQLQWTKEYAVIAVDNLFEFFEALSTQSKYMISLFSVLSGLLDAMPQAFVIAKLFPLPVLHVISSYAIQIKSLGDSISGSLSQRICEISVHFVHNIAEAYHIMIATGDNALFKLADIDAMGLNCLKLFSHIFRLAARESWIEPYSVSKSIGAQVGGGYEKINLVGLLCNICSQMVIYECTKRFESKGSHADSLKVIQAVSSAVKAFTRDAANARDSTATASIFEQEWMKASPEFVASILFMLLICKEGRASRGNAGIQILDSVLHSFVDQNTCLSGVVAADHAIRLACARLGAHLHPSFKTEVTAFGIGYEMSAVQVLDIIRASLFKYAYLLSSTGTGQQPMRLSTIIESLSQLVANAPLDGKNRVVEWATGPPTQA